MNKRVLVVEDEGLIRMTICDMLEELGLAYAEAANGADALAQLEADPGFDIMIADLGLPDMSGEQLLSLVRPLHPALRIVVASGRSAQVGKGNPVFDGVQFLEKPFDLSQFQRVIESA